MPRPLLYDGAHFEVWELTTATALALWCHSTASPIEGWSTLLTAKLMFLNFWPHLRNLNCAVVTRLISIDSPPSNPDISSLLRVLLSLPFNMPCYSRVFSILILVSNQVFLSIANVVCYNPNQLSNSPYSPCDTASSVHSACCAPGDACTSNGYCLGNGGYAPILTEAGRRKQRTIRDINQHS